MNYEAAPRAAGLWVRLLACLVSSRRASTRQGPAWPDFLDYGVRCNPAPNRMPVVLKPEAWPVWLGEEPASRSFTRRLRRIRRKCWIGCGGDKRLQPITVATIPAINRFIDRSSDTKVPPSARRYDPPAISRMNRLEDRPISAGPVKHKEARKNCSGEDAYAIAGNAMHRRSQHLTPACRYLSFVHGSRQPKTQRNAPTTRTSSTSALGDGSTWSWLDARRPSPRRRRSLHWIRRNGRPRRSCAATRAI